MDKPRHMAMRGGWWTFAEVLSERAPFVGGGGPMHGNPVSPDVPVPLPDNCQLPPEWRDALHSAQVDYVVWDYGTPIAWHVLNVAEWIIPEVRYSKTSTRHQNLLRTACGVVAEQEKPRE